MPSDLEDFRSGDSLLRSLHAHLLRRGSVVQRMADVVNYHGDNLNGDYLLQHQSKQAQMVTKKQKFQKEVNPK